VCVCVCVCVCWYHLSCIFSLFCGFSHAGYLAFEIEKEALAYEGSQALPVCLFGKNNIIYIYIYICVCVCVCIGKRFIPDRAINVFLLGYKLQAINAVQNNTFTGYFITTLTMIACRVTGGTAPHILSVGCTPRVANRRHSFDKGCAGPGAILYVSRKR
jgi:hypothetical protein